MKKIKIFKNEKFGMLSITQGNKHIAYVSLKELKDFLNDYDKDICYLENEKE